jgi:nicotinamide-nucleotide amidase
MDSDKIIRTLAQELKNECLHAKLKIVTAESCTGGLVAGAITSIPGSSDIFERGFVTYSNEAKIENLGVPPNLIAEKGAVSLEVACAMAEGALRRSKAKLSISVTGIAGPTGAMTGKPIGRVHIAAGLQSMATIGKTYDFGDIGRNEVRKKSVIAALELALERLKHSDPH